MDEACDVESPAESLEAFGSGRPCERVERLARVSTPNCRGSVDVPEFYFPDVYPQRDFSDYDDYSWDDYPEVSIVPGVTFDGQPLTEMNLPDPWDEDPFDDDSCPDCGLNGGCLTCAGWYR